MQIDQRSVYVFSFPANSYASTLAIIRGEPPTYLYLQQLTLRLFMRGLVFSQFLDLALQYVELDILVYIATKFEPPST